MDNNKTTIFTAIKTKIFKPEFDIKELLNYIPSFGVSSIIAISTKIISLMENNLKPLQTPNPTNTYSLLNKTDLVKKHGGQCISKPDYLPILTINQGILICNGGIDESNGNGSFIIWPENCNESAKRLWNMLSAREKHTQFAILLTDTRTAFMRRGAVGICTGFYGLEPLKNYIGQEDLFGQKLKGTKVNVVDSLAAMSVLMMGETNEQTPIVMIRNAQNLHFTHTNHTMLNELNVTLEEDIYLQGIK